MNPFLMAAVVAVVLTAPPQAHAAPRADVVPQPWGMRDPQPGDARLDAAARLVRDRAAAARGEARHGAAAARLERLAAVPSRFAMIAVPGREPDAQAFVHLTQAADADGLRAAGADVLAQVDDIAVVRLPASRLAELATLGSVRSVALSLRASAALDSSRRRTGVTRVQAGTAGLPQAYTGAGVMLGVLDSGLDYRHPDFRTSDAAAPGASRVQALLDFSQGTNGAECRKGQLDSLTCPQIDGSGGSSHGTHVTGTAGGNGRRNSAYIGMAPQADLMFVKGIRDAQSDGGFSEADIVAGVQYLFGKAHAVRKPAVVNLSLGSHFGPHDGTSLYERALDRLTGPGRIIVAAAGNSGGDRVHGSFAAAGTDFTSSLEMPFGLFASDGGVLDIWYAAGTSISFGLAAYSPGDLANPVAVSVAAAPGQLQEGTLLAGGTTPIAEVRIDARTTSDAGNGARNVLIEISEPTSPGGVDPSSLIWTVYSFGSGTPDLWILGGVFAPPLVGQPSYFRNGDDAKTVATPATARKLIAVGSTVTRTEWIDAAGNLRTQPGAVLDQISTFSSRGPSRDGRILPHLTAPGEAVLAPLSQHFPAPTDEVAFGGGYLKQQGTSMAAPHITGIVALMLQRNRFLTPENVRDLLQQGATPVGPLNNVFGAGKVDAVAALALVPDPIECQVTLANGLLVPCDESLGGVALAASPNPTRGGSRIAFLLERPGPAHVSLHDVQGRRVRVLHDGALAAGAHAIDWDGADSRGLPLRSGIYFVRLLTPSRVDRSRLVVVR